MAKKTEQTEIKSEVICKAEAYILEIYIGVGKGSKVKLKPADGFGVKVPETDKYLIAFANAKGGVLLMGDTLFAFPKEFDINSLLSLKQQHTKLLVTIDVNKKEVISITVK